MPSWNAQRLPKKDRFPYWREVLCETYTSLQPVADCAEDFQGTVRSALLHDLNVTTIASGRQKIYRRKHEIRQDSDWVYFLNLQMKGQSRAVQFGREALLNPGDFSLVDSREPYIIDYCSDDWVQHSFRIPGPLLSLALPKAERRMGVRYGLEAPLVSIAASFLRSVAKAGDGLKTSEMALSRQIISLVGLAAGSCSEDEADERNETLRDSLARSILEFIAANLHDPDLSPAQAAAHFRVSVRYVHKALEGSGVTFGKTLLDGRLERCAVNLLSEKSAPIGEIAFRWGFNDLSHFSRSFRAKYSLSPKEYRIECMGGSRHAIIAPDAPLRDVVLR